MKAPEKIYIDHHPFRDEWEECWYSTPAGDKSVEYIHTDIFIERVINFLNYKLDDVVATRIPGTIIPHHVAKQELIKYFKFSSDEVKDIIKKEEQQ